jgi:hypothetical protein
MALMVMVEVPEGVTTGGGAVVVRLAVLPQAAAYRTVQSRVAARAPHDANAWRGGRCQTSSDP